MNAPKQFLCFAILIGLTFVIGCGPSASTAPDGVSDEYPAVQDEPLPVDPTATAQEPVEEFVDPPAPEPTEQGGGTGSAIGKVFRKIQEEE